jgi:branched-chain amino acid transport system substrate-binding protein
LYLNLFTNSIRRRARYASARPRLARWMLAGALAATVAVAAGCSGSSLDNTTHNGDALTIGLVWPQSGPYKAIGDDQVRGWQLYLDQHGGKLGGRPVTTATGDERTSAATALTAAKRLVEGDHASVLVGTASGEANAAIADYATSHKLPFIGTGGRASSIKDVTWVWDTSWLSNELGKAIAPYMLQKVHGPVYTIGPDYQGGWDNVNGFTDAYKALGGKLANPDGKTTWTTWAPVPTTDYLPYLTKIKDSGAKAVFTFYAGTAAVQFVKQYQQAHLGIPLYASGFLTEDKESLAAQGDAATGVTTVLNYANNLDNPANRAFAPAYQQKYQRTPTIYAVAGWDAALVLDQAITAAENNQAAGSAPASATASPASTSPSATSPSAGPASPGTISTARGGVPTAAAINAAIGRLGAISSPRGDWRFGGQHSPNQPYYLRIVQFDGRAQANFVQQTLTTLTN